MDNHRVRDDAPMLAFSATDAAKQKNLEQQFDARLEPAAQRHWLKQMSSQPNQVGSSHDTANADFMLENFREWGWYPHIETFSVLYPTLKKLALELHGPHLFTASLNSPRFLAMRPRTSMIGALPFHNVYSADGDVTADLVYVKDSGMPQTGIKACCNSVPGRFWTRSTFEKATQLMGYTKRERFWQSAALHRRAIQGKPSCACPSDCH
jgi:hypothetical protein